MKLITTFIIVLISILGYSQDSENFTRFYPTKFKENITLQNYHIKETYKLNSTQYILIGSPKKFDPKDEGLRLIRLKKSANSFVINYKSKGMGESYVFRPSFYQGNNKTIITCESAFEYSCGLSTFLLQNDTVRYIGHMNVAVMINEREDITSATPFLDISESNGDLTFKFKKRSSLKNPKIEKLRLIYYPGSSRHEEVLKVSNIIYYYNTESGWKMDKK